MKLKGLYSTMLEAANQAIYIVDYNKNVEYTNGKQFMPFQANNGDFLQKLKHFSEKDSQQNLEEFIFDSNKRQKREKGVFDYSKLKGLIKRNKYEVEKIPLQNKIAIFIKDITESEELKTTKISEKN